MGARDIIRQCGERSIVASEGRGLLQITVIVAPPLNSSHPKSTGAESSVT